MNDKETGPISRHESIRGYFAYELHQQMSKDSSIWVVTGDLGYRMLDSIRRDYPDRFINAGAAEQAAVGMGVGLALMGKKPFVYSITPFLLYRPFETIRNYIHHEKIPVRLVGSGFFHDYAHDGYSHWATEQVGVMNLLRNIKAEYPETKEEIPELVDKMVKEDKPWYINLRR